jgi:hypothetical protein
MLYRRYLELSAVMKFEEICYRGDPSNTWKFGRKGWSSLPSCLLCALPIVAVWINGDGPTRREMDAEQEWWKTYDDSAKEHVLVPSADVEKPIFHKQPQIWTALYRGSELFPEKLGLHIWLNRPSSGGTGSTASPHWRHSFRWRLGGSKVSPQPAPSTNRESIGLYLYAQVCCGSAGRAWCSMSHQSRRTGPLLATSRTAWVSGPCPLLGAIRAGD